MKLGWPLTTPLLRTYAVRRETSPCAGSRRNVVIMNSPSGKLSSGPTSTLFGYWLTNAGATMKPERRNGDDAADHRAEAERRAFEEHASASSVSASASSSTGSRSDVRRRRAARVSGSTSAAARVAPRVASRIQSVTQMTAITAPTITDGRADDQADEDAGHADARSRSARGSGPKRAACRCSGSTRLLVRIQSRIRSSRQRRTS